MTTKMALAQIISFAQKRLMLHKNSKITGEEKFVFKCRIFKDSFGDYDV